MSIKNDKHFCTICLDNKGEFVDAVNCLEAENEYGKPIVICLCDKHLNQLISKGRTP